MWRNFIFQIYFYLVSGPWILRRRRVIVFIIFTPCTRLELTILIYCAEQLFHLPYLVISYVTAIILSSTQIRRNCRCRPAAVISRTTPDAPINERSPACKNPPRSKIRRVQNCATFATTPRSYFRHGCKYPANATTPRFPTRFGFYFFSYIIPLRNIFILFICFTLFLSQSFSFFSRE